MLDKTVIRVMHVIGSTGIGGAERHVIDLCLIQRSQGLRVRVALPKPGELSDALTQVGIDWVVFGRGSRLNPFILWRLWRGIGLFQPDLIHAHMPRSIVMAAQVANGMPLIGTAHNIVKNMRPFLRCAQVICVSQQVRNSLTALGFNADRTVVIHNAIKPSELPMSTRAVTRKALGWDKDRILLCVARLVPAKGQIYAIRAMPRLLAAEPRMHLVLVGTGSDESALKKVVEEMGLGARVQFLGTRTDVPFLLNAADIYLQPSIKEGFCIAFLEAMSAGLPCIGTRTGAIPEMIENQNLGVLIEPADSAAIESAVLALVNSPDKAEKMGVCARTSAAQQFSQAKQGADTLGVYTRVIRCAPTSKRGTI